MTATSNKNESQVQHIVGWLQNHIILNQSVFLSVYYVYGLGYEKGMSDYREYEQGSFIPPHMPLFM